MNLLLLGFQVPACWGGRSKEQKKYEMHAKHNNSEMLALLLHIDILFLSYEMTWHKNVISSPCECDSNF
jgi:hypothetical protein